MISKGQHLFLHILNQSSIGTANPWRQHGGGSQSAASKEANCHNEEAQAHQLAFAKPEHARIRPSPYCYRLIRLRQSIWRYKGSLSRPSWTFSPTVWGGLVLLATLWKWGLAIFYKISFSMPTWKTSLNSYYTISTTWMRFFLFAHIYTAHWRRCMDNLYFIIINLFTDTLHYVYIIFHRMYFCTSESLYMLYLTHEFQ